MISNHSMRRIGAGGLAHFQNLHLGSLTPTAVRLSQASAASA